MSSSFRRRQARLIRTSECQNEAEGTSIQSALHLRLPGTKPWTGGLTLSSSGLREIDAILGGGQPLGTCILVEEDRLTYDLGMCIARYWAAEAVANGQTLVLPAMGDKHNELLNPSSAADPGGHIGSLDYEPQMMSGTGGASMSEVITFVKTIPRDLHLDKFRSQANMESDGGTNLGDRIKPIVSPSHEKIASIQEGDEEDDDFDESTEERARANEATDSSPDDGLLIAWQYRESVQKERLGKSAVACSSEANSDTDTLSREVYCHSYDLAGRMIEQHDASTFINDSGIDIVECSCHHCPGGRCSETQHCGFRLFSALIQRIQHHLSRSVGKSSGVVVRLLFVGAAPAVTSIALPLLVSYVREHSLPVVTMITVQPWLYLGTSKESTALSSLRRTADTVFALDGFASFRDPPPPEFRDLAGILSIRKIATMGCGHFANATSGRRPPADRYGLKRDRRKLHIRLLHLPPEEESVGGSSTSGVRRGGGTVRSLEGGSPARHTTGQKGGSPSSGASPSLDF
mmetsp:Transcript_9363/g.20059  ORF Transcript_9363/g.20059 Transcript_9363/m.20059 type:complete len:518 (+) Transcript_9363:128-1681(+)